jgi:Ca-activated chloride channel family protein
MKRSDLRFGVAVLVLAAMTPAGAWAVPRPVAERIAEGNAAYARGEYDAALEAYRAAAPECPECPELAYNEGLVRYRQRDFIKARELFNNALTTRDLHLEARAKFNLGNVAYSEALEKLNTLPEAIRLAEEAIDRYRDAVELLKDLDQDDAQVQQDLADARANIETVALLVKDLLDKQKQQQEQQQSESDQSCDNPSQDQQQGDQQQQDQQEQQDENASSSEDQQQQGEQEQSEQEQEQQQQEGNSSEEQQQQQEQQQGQQDQQQAADQQQQQQAQQNEQQSAEQAAAAHAAAGEQRELTAEEVQRMLQSVRDKEAQRREQRARKMRVVTVPVERDW